jgi:hypothetical protein
MGLYNEESDEVYCEVILILAAKDEKLACNKE